MSDPRHWKDLFYFSRRERNALLALSLLIILITTFRHIVLPHFLRSDFETLKATGNLEFFRPDTSIQTEVNERQDSPERQRWYPTHAKSEPSDRWISAPAGTGEYPREQEIPLLIEINTADTLELDRLPGIGPYLARTIVRYREKLGGYVSVEQLLEVYRLSPETLERIRPLIRVDPQWIRPIDVNTASADELDLHPYLDRTQARAIVSYREKHGAYEHPEDLLKCAVIDTTLLRRIRPYLAPPSAGI